jgi:ATP-binding cassette subfamily B protein
MERVLVKAVRDGGPWLAALAVAALASAVAELLLPAALGRTVDAALGTAPAGRWLAASIGLVALIAAGELLTDLAAGSAGARATARLRHALLRRILAFDLRAADRYREGDLVGRLVGQVTVAGQAGPAAVMCLVGLLPPVGALVALTLIDPWLAGTFVVGLLVLGLLLRTYVTDLADAATRYQHTQSTIAARFVEALGGARTIGAAGTADREVARILEPLPALHHDGSRTWDAAGRAAARSAIAAPLTQIAVVAVGGLALAAGRLTPGELLAALQYATIGAGLGAAVSELGRLARSRAGSRRAAEILATPVRAHGAAELPPGRGRLELRGVTVTGMLDGIDLTVPGGTTLAIVGPSGAGKSTLAAVIGRLIDPDDGEATLDGVPLHRLRRDVTRRAIGCAFARPVLVGETVRDAITLGGADAETSARAACVDTVIERLPHGYETPLADAPFSGGEAQRLGLARALRAERLLVLDDAMSSLDTVTEHEISRALIGSRDRRTRVIVTHRVATAARVDAVAWLHSGRLRAYAPHAVLWDDPEYRALFRVDAC